MIDFSIANKKFNNWLTSYVKKEDVSCSVLILNNGKEIFKKHLGYADRENKVLIDDNTTFRLYSFTKTFTAIGIMTLYEKGIIDIYKPLREILPICKNFDKRIKVINLLQHNSGLEEVCGIKEMRVEGKVDFDKIILDLSKLPLKFEPNTKWEYLNTNYIILSLIIEHYSGLSFDKYLIENVFKPLNMNTVAFDFDNYVIENRAIGYEKFNGVIEKGKFVNTVLMSGAGASVGRLEDIKIFSNAVRDKNLLKKESWDLIFTKAESGLFGLGCYVEEENGSLCYRHTGGHIGFRILHSYFPKEEFAIIILSNTGAGFGDVRMDIRNQAYEIYFNKVRDNREIVMDKGFV